MKQKGISQEGIKLIATMTMLIDHIGAVLVYEWYMSSSIAAGTHIQWLWDLYMLLRIIGRIAFPIYCFLLVEGVHHTRNPKKYGIRLAVGMLLSEIPFDLAFSGGWDMGYNSVMVTLLLGFFMLEAMKRVSLMWKCLLVLPFFLLAELLKTDYAGNGILLIAFLSITRGIPHEKLFRFVGMILLLSFGAKINIGVIQIPMELFGLIGIGLVFLYNGTKHSYNKVSQWAFYLFYPVHLTLLWIVRILLFGAQYPV